MSLDFTGAWQRAHGLTELGEPDPEAIRPGVLDRHLLREILEEQHRKAVILAVGSERLRGDRERQDAVASVEEFSAGFLCRLMRHDKEKHTLELGTEGEGPYLVIVDRMDPEQRFYVVRKFWRDVRGLP